MPLCDACVMAGGAHGGFMLGHGLGVDLGRCGGCASPVGTYVRVSRAVYDYRVPSGPRAVEGRSELGPGMVESPGVCQVY